MIRYLLMVLVMTFALPAWADRFQTGDELYTWRKIGTITFYHAGVYIGNNQVIHVSGTAVSAARNLFSGKKLIYVIKSSLSGFAEGKPVKKGPTKPRFPPATIVKRAFSRLGKPYNWEPVSQNCQHFSSWVVSGSANSPFSADVKRAYDKALAKFGPKVSKAVKKAAKTVVKVAKKIDKTVKKVKKDINKAVKKVKDTITGKKKNPPKKR